jgi:hypothetical protein
MITVLDLHRFFLDDGACLAQVRGRGAELRLLVIRHGRPGVWLNRAQLRQEGYASKWVRRLDGIAAALHEQRGRLTDHLLAHLFQLGVSPAAVAEARRLPDPVAVLLRQVEEERARWLSRGGDSAGRRLIAQTLSPGRSRTDEQEIRQLDALFARYEARHSGGVAGDPVAWLCHTLARVGEVYLAARNLAPDPRTIRVVILQDSALPWWPALAPADAGLAWRQLTIPLPGLERWRLHVLYLGPGPGWFHRPPAAPALSALATFLAQRLDDRALAEDCVRLLTGCTRREFTDWLCRQPLPRIADVLDRCWSVLAAVPGSLLEVAERELERHANTPDARKRPVAERLYRIANRINNTLGDLLRASCRTGFQAALEHDSPEEVERWLSWFRPLEPSVPATLVRRCTAGRPGAWAGPFRLTWAVLSREEHPELQQKTAAALAAAKASCELTAEDVLTLMAVFGPARSDALRVLLDQSPELRRNGKFLRAAWSALGENGTPLHEFYHHYLATLTTVLSLEQMRRWCELLRLLPARQSP